jgi:hypothetical protein
MKFMRDVKAMKDRLIKTRNLLKKEFFFMSFMIFMSFMRAWL